MKIADHGIEKSEGEDGEKNREGNFENRRWNCTVSRREELSKVRIALECCYPSSRGISLSFRPDLFEKNKMISTC